jgi:iron complex transport system substrate-binding protein
MFSRYRCLFLLFLLSGCQSPQRNPSTPKPEPIALEGNRLESKGVESSGLKRDDLKSDDLGRAIEVPGDIKRLVVIGPGAIETVFALGASQKLVGRDSYADFPAAAKKIAVAGDYTGPSVEKCIALHPDLIIVQGETWDKARVEDWQKKIGAPVAALTATSVKEVQKDFLKIGRWVGRTKEAAALAKGLDGGRGTAKIGAFLEVGRSPLFTAGQGTLVDDVVRAGGYSNIASDVKGYQPFGLESLLARQPSAYIAPSSLSRAALLRELRASPTLSKLKCIREGRVIAIKGDYLLRPGPRLKLGIDQLRREVRRLSPATSSQ